MDQLKSRLEHRGMNKPEDMKVRLANAEKEINRAKEVSFYKMIVNDKMETCYSDFIHHINKKYQLLIEI